MRLNKAKIFIWIFAIALPGISQPSSAELPRAVRALLQPEIADCVTSTGKQMDEAIRATLTTLNRMNQSWTVEGLGSCLGGANNGPYWVFAQVRGMWREVLSATGQSLDPLHSRTNGWYDLELQQHSSATESVHIIYRFDGATYRSARCFVLTFPSDDDGKIASKPIQGPCNWAWQPAARSKVAR